MSTNSTPPPILPQPPEPSGLAIASLVLGILAVLLSFLLLGGLVGLVGLVLGLVHVIRKRGSAAMAWWGASLSAVGLIASIGFGALYYQGFKHISEISATEDSGVAVDEWKGVQAPNLSITTLDGKKLTLNDLRGKRVVLDFWATWCPPCCKEIPHFIQLFGETSRDDLAIIGISSENVDTLKKFIEKQGVNYPIASAAQLPAPYSDVGSIPTTFFIDRRGIIQDVLVGYHDLDSLRKHALQKDVEGEPKPPPSPTASELKPAAHPLAGETIWSHEIDGAQSLCVGDWDGDGVPEILVAAFGKKLGMGGMNGQLHVLGLDGAEKSKCPLPEAFSFIELGRHKEQGVRLLGHSPWGRKVSVMNGSGKQLWAYAAGLGVDGAHWGDLDGDGTDELIIGMNGFGGLHAVSADGKLLWHESKIGNVWNQAVIPAREGWPARVFATEAGGSVKVYDGQGKLIRTVRPKGKYCSKMTAAVVDEAATVQVVAMGDNSAIAFDESGQVAWFTPALSSERAKLQLVFFASGDVNGDGKREWAFIEATGDLVMVSPEGERLASIPGQRGVQSLAIAGGAKTRGILVTLKSNTLTAYSFK